MSQNLSPFCVYTIRHQRDLDEAYRGGGAGEFKENTIWKTGLDLFLKAEKSGQRMPVIFASADVTDRLVYYATLRDVQIDEAGGMTKYEFTHLKPIEGDLPLSSLKLRSTNQPLSDNFIRPYAICITPALSVDNGLGVSKTSWIDRTEVYPRSLKSLPYQG